MDKQQAEMFQVLRPIQYGPHRRTLVVLGAPRGGTSMLAGTLDKLGVYMGDRIGHQKEDPRFRQDTTLEQKLQAIADNNARHRIWGWKLPNSIYYYGDLHAQLINPVFLTVYRNPFSVACSSARHDGRPLRQPLLRVPVDHYKEMHKVIAKYANVPLAACHFENVTRSAAKADFLTALIDFTGLEVSPEQRAAALEFIDYDKGYQR